MSLFSERKSVRLFLKENLLGVLKARTVLCIFEGKSFSVFLKKDLFVCFEEHNFLYFWRKINVSICEGKVYFDIFEEINILMRKMKKATELKGCENNIAKFNDLKEIKVIDLRFIVKIRHVTMNSAKKRTITIWWRLIHRLYLGELL